MPRSAIDSGCVDFRIRSEGNRQGDPPRAAEFERYTAFESTQYYECFPLI
jgi:hypothetical protein